VLRLLWVERSWRCVHVDLPPCSFVFSARKPLQRACNRSNASVDSLGSYGTYPPHEGEQLFGALQLWSACQFLPDNLEHMELAHLHGTLRHGRKQPSVPVTNDGLYLGAAGADGIKPLPICGVRLTIDIHPVKRRACVRVLEQHHPETPSEKGSVHDDNGRVWRRWHETVGNECQPAPHSPLRATMLRSQLRESAMTAHVLVPQRSALDAETSTETFMRLSRNFSTRNVHYTKKRVNENRNG